MQAGDYVRLAGKTFRWRKLLKELGLTWEPELRAWVGRIEPHGPRALPSLCRGVARGELRLI